MSCLGVTPDMPVYKQKSTILFNQIIRIIFIALLGMIVMLNFTVHPLLRDQIFLWALPFIGFSLYLNLKGKVNTSAFMLGIILPIISLVGSLFLRIDVFGDSVLVMILPKFSIIISTIVPTVIIGMSQRKKAILCSVTGIICLLLYDQIHVWAGFSNEHLSFSSKHYPLMAGGIIILGSIFGLLMIFIQKINVFYDQLTNEQKAEIIKQRDDLSLKNEEIQLHKEELEAQRDEIEVQLEILQNQKNEILKQHKQIKDSIQYALKIQEAVMSNKVFLERYFKGSYLINIPRDIVSGDFYWFKKIGDHLLVAVADCTGHGVPGAFMSMLGISLLNEIYDKYKFLHDNEHKEVIHPNIILDELKEMLKVSLHQNTTGAGIRDGLDIGLCVFSDDLKTVEYASANRPLYIVRGNELIEIAGNSMPTGIYLKQDIKFDNHFFDLQSGDRIHLSSDGYISQFGGPKHEKFKSKRYKEVLLESRQLTIDEQSEVLKKTLFDWKAEEKQVDDILVLGLEI